MLKPGGRVAYFNIFITHDIPEEERRRIRDSGAGNVYTRAQQRDLLRSAGFVRISETDVTAGYERIQRALYQAGERHAKALRRARGASVFESRQQLRRDSLQRLEAGVLRRSLFVAGRP